MAISTDALCRHWLHSYEEDTEEEMVFRPANFSFPPSRGRTGFDLKPDHRLVQIGIAPVDGPTETEGTWRLGDDDSLSLFLGPDSALRRVLRIKSAGPDRLVVRK